MSSNPFGDASRRYLKTSPFLRYGAWASSLLASLALVALFPLLYLFVDLLTYQGRVPALADLSAKGQERARGEWPTAEWPLGVPYPTEEARYAAATRQYLADTVSPDAAAAYSATPDPAGPPTGRDLGTLSLAVRERHRWAGPLVAAATRLAPWSWRSPDALTGLFAAASLLVILRALLLNATAYWAALATIDAATRLRRAVYTHGQRLSSVAISPQAQAEAGELVSRRVDEIQDGLAASLASALRLPLTVALLAAMFFSTHIFLSLGLLALAALVWLVVGQAAAWFRRDARLARRRTESRLGMLRESIGGLLLAKGYLMERFSQTRFERHLTDLSKSTWRRQRGETFTRPTLFSIVVLVALAMLYLAGRVVLAGEMSVAALVLKGALLATLVGAVGQWLAGRARVRQATAAAADVFEFLDRRGDVAQAVDAEFLQPMQKKFELIDVSVREPGTGRMVLENVAASVPAGTRAAFVTATPEEGHALAHLLTRFLDPTAGEVRIDGKNTRWVTYESIRTQVAVVLEQSLTFSDTVMNNIGCGDAGFTLPQVIEAAKLAHAHQFIQRLPYGYETRIGTAGYDLSLGQRFRVALARAILRDPSILLIEEPREGMDADSLVLIDDTVTRIRQGRTILFLASRPSTMRTADEVFVLRGGRLVASGPHAELLESSDLYRMLHAKQQLAAGGV